MRLKDADELLIKLQWHCDLNCPYTKKQRDVMCDSCLLGDAKDYIDRAPIVDAVEVVRCENCIHKKNLEEGTFGNILGYDGDCNIAMMFVRDNYYCVWGERREKQ